MSARLVTLIRDALTGVPVSIGFMDLPKVLADVKALAGDPYARVQVFEAAVKGCITTDPALRASLRAILAAADADTVKTPALQVAS